MCALFSIFLLILEGNNKRCRQVVGKRGRGEKEAVEARIPLRPKGYNILRKKQRIIVLSPGSARKSIISYCFSQTWFLAACFRHITCGDFFFFLVVSENFNVVSQKAIMDMQI